jgi:hypothetical protein
MIEAVLILKEKYHISFTSISYLKKSKRKKYFSETPLAKKYMDISNRNGVYFMLLVLIGLIVQITS